MPPGPKGTSSVTAMGGARTARCNAGMVRPCQGIGWGRGKWRGSVAFLALQRFELQSSETQGGWPDGDKGPPTPGSRHSAALAYVCQPRVCSSYSQAELKHKKKKNKTKQFISLREKKRGSIHHSIYITAKTSCQNKHTHTKIL